MIVVEMNFLTTLIPINVIISLSSPQLRDSCTEIIYWALYMISLWTLWQLRAIGGFILKSSTGNTANLSRVSTSCRAEHAGRWLWAERASSSSDFPNLHERGGRAKDPRTQRRLPGVRGSACWGNRRENRLTHTQAVLAIFGPTPHQLHGGCFREVNREKLLVCGVPKLRRAHF